MAVFALSGYFSSTVLLGFLVICLILYILKRRPSGLPPFPATPLPIVGNLFSLERDPRQQFANWRQEYGDVFSLYMGNTLVVVLNGFECIRDALVKNAAMFSGRPDHILFKQLLRDRGIAATSGSVWKTQRTFSLTAMRDFGFGRKSMEGKILEETEEVIQFFAEKKGEKYDYGKIYNISTSNILCSLVFGNRFDFNDKHFLECCDVLGRFAKSLSLVAFSSFIPFLRYLPGQRDEMAEAMRSSEFLAEKLIKPEIQRHYDEYSGSPEDFISAYIKEIKDRGSSGKDSSVLKDNFTQTITDLFMAGTETTATSLKWLVLFLIHHPHIQEKCFQEIRDKVGLEDLPTLNDKPLLPYVQATLLETLRIANIAPFGLLHAVADHTTFRGFTLPKGTVIMLNMGSALLDPKTWPNPNEFKPERFLNEGGEVFKPDAFIPFSMGRRVCFGEALAKMELFLLGAALMQRFEFKSPEDEPDPSLEPVMGITLVPKPYKVRAIPRGEKQTVR